MPNNGSQIRVAGTGRILVAATGATPPAAPKNTTEEWAAGWTELGYTSTDGIKFNKKDKIDPVDTWQSVSPARFIYSDRDLTVKFQLLQFNKDTLPFFMGGGAVTSVGGAGVTDTYSFAMGAEPQKDERQLGIEFKDGSDVTYRFVIPRGQVTETEEIALTRTGALKLGVTFTALAVEGSSTLATWIMKDKSYA
ncbi:phage tail tube protein [Streptomyces lichenis]|uniref:Phage tail protein n=1 Tax=Streptomyces lichenis TaxID=2306967 RepID=A0ABT0IG68_9ACTN|nr:phage tail protein [Streptomyces lichenis]MCK8680322.1 phage tail protein [Streptomyces lichenis]